MSIEQSFGIIPLRKNNNQWQLFMVQMKSGLWGFPKGHAERGESPQQTAERELHEETGLTVTEYLPSPALTEEYISPKTNNPKTVTYFLAYAEGMLALCPLEIITGYWAPFDHVFAIMGFYASKRKLLAHIKQILSQQP